MNVPAGSALVDEIVGTFAAGGSETLRLWLTPTGWAIEQDRCESDGARSHVVVSRSHRNVALAEMWSARRRLHACHVPDAAPTLFS